MKVKIDDISDAAAVEALCKVAQEWLRKRGLEVYQVYSEIREIAANEFQQLPDWVKRKPEKVTDESGTFSRAMLLALSDGTDDEIQEWTSTAIEEVDAAKAHVLDPITLGISGLILIGAILAARVKKIGSVEFYEGIPENLANVLKAGASFTPIDD